MGGESEASEPEKRSWRHQMSPRALANGIKKIGNQLNPYRGSSRYPPKEHSDSTSRIGDRAHKSLGRTLKSQASKMKNKWNKFWFPELVYQDGRRPDGAADHEQPL